MGWDVNYVNGGQNMYRMFFKAKSFNQCMDWDLSTRSFEMVFGLTPAELNCRLKYCELKTNKNLFYCQTSGRMYIAVASTAAVIFSGFVVVLFMNLENSICRTCNKKDLNVS